MKRYIYAAKSQLTYRYDGPVYYQGSTIKDHIRITLEASSRKQAAARMNYIVRKDYGPIAAIKQSLIQVVDLHQPQYCQKCGTQLTDGRYCPSCDDNDDSYVG